MAVGPIASAIVWRETPFRAMMSGQRAIRRTCDQHMFDQVTISFGIVWQETAFGAISSGMFCHEMCPNPQSRLVLLCEE